jgi:phage FluMu gp28-like protein
MGAAACIQWVLGPDIDPALSETARATLARLQRALPRREWLAVSSWLTTFHSYQLEWLLDWSRFAILNKARQIGASHTYAAAAVLWAMLGETTTVISIGEREAIEVLDKARGHALVLARLGSEWARTKRNRSTGITLQSNGRILALPSTSGGRSFSGNVILDEMAYHDDPDSVWDGAGGTVLHGYKLRAMSTPNGVGNLWHEMVTNRDRHKGFRVHQVTLDQAIAAGLKVDVEACWKQARNDPRVFDQLFNCSFLDGNLQYIPTQLFIDCFGAWPVLAGGQVYAGLDIGETRDRTVLVVIRRKGNKRQLLHMETHARTDDALLDELVRKAIKDFGTTLVCADSTGLGRFPAQRMSETWGRRFEGVDFTLKSKEDLATGLYDAVARHELELPVSFVHQGIDEMPLLREDVYAIRREVTSSGNVRFVAARSEKGHADRAWALMLALHAAGSMSPMFAALQS